MCCIVYFQDTASQEKERLEEKQRAARKERAKDEEEWSTRWRFSSLYTTFLTVGPLRHFISYTLLYF